MTREAKISDDVVLECDLPQSPEKVWRALTDQDLLGRWLMPTDLRPEVGTHFRLLPAEPTHDAPMVDCEVIEAIPHRTLRWRQTEREASSATTSIESIVTFELSPSQRGTHLRVVHDQFRRVAIEARSSDTNVIRLADRHTRLQSRRLPKIVCALHAFRRAA
jgi:uncharacterized protein YndB with AHSA1/START domain